MNRELTKKQPQRLWTSLALIAVFALLLAACGGGPEDGDAGAEGGGEVVNGEEEAAGGEDAGGGEVSDASLCANSYLPVVEGATWTYNGTGGPEGDFQFTETITEVRADGFTMTGTFDELTRTTQWQCTEEGLTALQYGGGAAGSVSVSGSQFTLETTGVSGVTLPASPATGNTWTQVYEVSGSMTIPGGPESTVTGTVSLAYTVEGEDSANVPAGDFNTLLISNTIQFDLQAVVEDITVPMLISGTNTAYYAPGVGWVQLDGTNDMFGETMASTITLLSYSIP